MAAFNHSSQTRSPFNVECRIIRPNGEERAIHMIGEPGLDDDGKSMSMTGTVHDITERKNAEDELRKLSSVVAQSPHMIFITDTKGVIEYANEKFYEVTGYSIDEVRGRGANLLQSQGTPRAVYADLWDTIKAGKVWQCEMLDRCKNGTTYWADVTIAPIRSQDGVITHYFSSHENITLRKDAEDKMREAKEQAVIANRAKSNLMANMSHELRTPLNAIIGFSDSMRVKIFGPIGNDKYEEYVEDIHFLAQHLLELINDILDVSAVEAGAVKLHEENVNVADVIDAAIRIIRPRANECKVTITSSLFTKMPNIFADERRVKQIFLNLLSNAVKFTLEGGEIVVNSRLNTDGTLTITVADTGIGMDSDEVEKALSKFGQVDSGHDRKHDGTGLGLPLTVGLMECHGGTLNVKSQKGLGTQVTVTFPKERVVAPANAGG